MNIVIPEKTTASNARITGYNFTMHFRRGHYNLQRRHVALKNSFGQRFALAERRSLPVPDARAHPGRDLRSKADSEKRRRAGIIAVTTDQTG